jgi:hypothetical protein
MGNVKLIVIYPCPKDIESFARFVENNEEHVREYRRAYHAATGT